jgi:hypothetical protein
MIGYFSPFRDELKIKEDKIYGQYYCGQCVSLRKQYGYISSSLLIFETVFISILFSDTYEDVSKQICTIIPLVKINVKKHPFI